MKDAYYFPHDTNATQDPKMMRLIMRWGLMGVGAYWVIIELLHQQPDGRMTKEDMDAALDFYSRIDPWVKAEDSPLTLQGLRDDLVQGGLLSHQDGVYYSERVLRNKAHRDNISGVRAEVGRRGAMARWQLPDGKMANDGKGKERKGKEKKGKETEYSPEFEQFWGAYPNRVGKGKAWEAWQKANPNLEVCIKALSWQIKQNQWVKDGGRFIPHPTTWLNQGRWNDEPVKTATGNTAAPVAGKYDHLGEKV